MLATQMPWYAKQHFRNDTVVSAGADLETAMLATEMFASMESHLHI